MGQVNGNVDGHISLLTYILYPCPDYGNACLVCNQERSRGVCTEDYPRGREAFCYELVRMKKPN